MGHGTDNKSEEASDHGGQTETMEGLVDHDDFSVEVDSHVFPRIRVNESFPLDKVSVSNATLTTI